MRIYKSTLASELENKRQTIYNYTAVAPLDIFSLNQSFENSPNV